MAAAVVFFTNVFVPARQILLETAGNIVWQYRKFQRDPLIINRRILAPSEVLILAKHADEFSSVILINKSLPKRTEIISENTLVGFVLESAGSISKVELITASSAKVGGVLGRSGIIAEFEGRGAGLLEAHLPKGSDVSEGDAVFYGENIGLVVGGVVRVDDNPANPFVDVFVQSPINITTLQVVSYGR